MDIAIVTGAETPLGLSLIQRLVRQGYRVHGIGNNFAKVTYADPQFKAHPVDLSKLAEVTEVMQAILDEEKSLDLLIHAIDVTPGAAFEKLSVGNLEAILKIGLLGPVMLTRLAMPNLLRFRGQLINVIPANKSGCPASAVNALLEGGLREMNRVLFDRARDAGLRVTNLVLRQNPEPDSLAVKSSEQTHIDLEDVARSVERLIDPDFANVPAELVLYPRTSAQSDQALPELPEPVDPYSEVVLPPREYCPPKQPKIPTQEKQKVERTIPYTDDEMEDKIAAAIEDFEAHPERYEKPEPQPERSPAPAQGHRPDSSEDGGSNKRRRGRRRGGRNRSRDRDSNARPPQQDGGPPKFQEGDARADGRKPREDSPRQSKPEQGDGGKTQPESKSKTSRRGGRDRSKAQDTAAPSEPKARAERKPDARRKPEAKSGAATKSKSTKSKSKSKSKPEAKADVPKTSAGSQSAPQADSVQRKVPAKKAAKKTAAKKTVKTAAKKKAAKKAVKKAE